MRDVMINSRNAIARGLAAAIALSTLPIAALASTTDASGPNTSVVRGIVTNVPSATSFTVRDANGTVETVALHVGTVISPAWDSVQRGSYVTIDGFNRNGDLQANAIDTFERTGASSNAGVSQNSGNSAGAPQEANPITGMGQ